MILGAVGKNASGKDYFLKYISTKYGLPMYTIGDIVRDLADEEGLEKTRDNLLKIANKYMDKYGDSYFPNRLIQKIKDSGQKNVLVSGIRPPSDVQCFKDAFGEDFILAAVIVDDDKVRYERTIARGTERDKITFEEFLELDKREEAQFHTSKSIEMADYRIDSNLTGDEFFAALDEFYNTVIKPRLNA
jgi:dephospho-CoA kinase